MSSWLFPQFDQVATAKLTGQLRECKTIRMTHLDVNADHSMMRPAEKITSWLLWDSDTKCDQKAKHRRLDRYRGYLCAVESLKRSQTLLILRPNQDKRYSVLMCRQ